MPELSIKLRICRSNSGISLFTEHALLIIVGLVVTPSMGWPGIIALKAIRSAESKRINIASTPLD
jgi:NhaP-type Na+/H+ and K+/H+ antiporter